MADLIFCCTCTRANDNNIIVGPTKPFPSPVSSPILHGHRSRYDAHSAYHFISDNDAVTINNYDNDKRNHNH